MKCNQLIAGMEIVTTEAMKLGYRLCNGQKSVLKVMVDTSGQTFRMIGCEKCGNLSIVRGSE